MKVCLAYLVPVISLNFCVPNDQPPRMKTRSFYFLCLPRVLHHERPNEEKKTSELDSTFSFGLNYTGTIKRRGYFFN